MKINKQILLGALCWPAASQAQLHLPHIAVAPKRCYVPMYDYQSARASLAKSAATFTAVLVEAPPNAAALVTPGRVDAPPKARFFQLAQPRLLVNHCAVSRVAVSLWEDGRCVVNLLAEQSPADIPLDILEPAARFKRNRFTITVRGYGFYPLRGESEDGALSKLGQPELFRLQQSFWVERGDSIEQRINGHFGQITVSKADAGTCVSRLFVADGIPVQSLVNRVNRMEVELRIE